MKYFSWYSFCFFFAFPLKSHTMTTMIRMYERREKLFFRFFFFFIPVVSIWYLKQRKSNIYLPTKRHNKNADYFFFLFPSLSLLHFYFSSFHSFYISFLHFFRVLFRSYIFCFVFVFGACYGTYGWEQSNKYLHKTKQKKNENRESTNMSWEEERKNLFFISFRSFFSFARYLSNLMKSKLISFKQIFHFASIYLALQQKKNKRKNQRILSNNSRGNICQRKRKTFIIWYTHIQTQNAKKMIFILNENTQRLVQHSN